jgi:ketosteroid isomerase-like protein
MTDHSTTLQAMYAAFAAGDIAGVMAHLADDIDWEHDWHGRPPSLFRPGRGHARVQAFFAELARDWEFRRFEPQGFLAGGNQVAVPVQLEIVHRATGAVVRDLEMHLWTFGADGKVARMRHLIDTAQVIAAEGR